MYSATPSSNLTKPSSKPPTALADPAPFSVILPKLSQHSNSADYEAELCIVIGKACKNVSEEEALDYVLGYTAANDVSCRAEQFAQSQWCFSKGYDGSCPIGPTIVSRDLIPDASKLHIRGLKNHKVLQDCPIRLVLLCSTCLLHHLLLLGGNSLMPFQRPYLPCAQDCELFVTGYNSAAGHAHFDRNSKTPPTV